MFSIDARQVRRPVILDKKMMATAIGNGGNRRCATDFISGAPCVEEALHVVCTEGFLGAN